MSELERTVVHGLNKNDVIIDYKMLINLPFIKIEKPLLSQLLNGKITFIEKEDNKYGLVSETKNDIIGIIEIKNNQVINRKMFGNRIGKDNV